MNSTNIIEASLLRNRKHRCLSERPISSERPLSPIAVFRARTEARAALFTAGELDLHEAVDGLQAAAIANGLVDSIGQDAVQAILASAFREARRHV